jgi:hypothetical protein
MESTATCSIKVGYMFFSEACRKLISIPRWKIAAIVLMTMGVSVAAQAATYYVNARSGADANDGRSPTSAWKTLNRVNHAHLLPGDRVLFRSGDVWHGQLAPGSSGSPGDPIVFSRYGKGALPLIAADGKAENAVLLYNVQEIELRHLAISNHGEGVAVRRGVDIVLDNFGTARHIVVDDLYVHDVNGTEAKKDNGGIVFQTLGRKVPSRFDDLEIERNIVWKVDRSGIVGESANYKRTRWFASLNVVIADNYVDDVGGDGIVPWATEGAVVDGNIARRCNQRSKQYNAGIWEWSADDTFFTMNEAFETKGTRDGEGFDADFNSRGTRFFRNFSHNNDGGFMLICTPVKRNERENAGNSGAVISENISHDDDGLLISLSGADDVLVNDNVFYVGTGHHVQFITSEWKGWSDNAWLVRNHFFIEGSVAFGHSVKRLSNGSYVIAPGWGGATNIHFEGNTYTGSVVDWPVQPDDSHVWDAHPARIEWSSEPMFNPKYPLQYPEFLAAHRAWMVKLFAKQFPDASGVAASK